MKDRKKALDNTILEIDKILEKYKKDEELSEVYDRIKKLKEKRNLNTYIEQEKNTY